MVQSKEWNWSEVTEDIWNEPSEDIYYYLDRWRRKGFNRFLDLGCGLGRHSILFAENGFEVYAFDLSQDGIDTLNRRASESGLIINTTLGDINSLPYEDESFDCLLAYHVISHTDTQGITGIANEIHRVLRKGGEFFITLCSKNSPSYCSKDYPRIDENTIIKTEEPEVDVPHFYSNLDDVRRILRTFELIRIRQIEDIFGDNSTWHYFVHGRKSDSNYDMN
ncbi:MAG: class I SAM-dependent methyltransferase [Armatimonadota bacterium]